MILIRYLTLYPNFINVYFTTNAIVGLLIAIRFKYGQKHKVIMTKDEKKLENLRRRLEKRGVFERAKAIHESLHKQLK